MKLTLILTFSLFLIACADNRTSTEKLNAGIKEFNDTNYISALNELIECIEKDSQNSTAYYYKALTEVKLKKNQDALISFQKSLERDSLNYQALAERAKLKITLGDFISAINDCDKAQFLKKDYADLYLTKADAYEHLDDQANAVIGYEHAIKYGKNDGETFFKLGLLYLNHDKTQLACEYLRKAGDLGFMESFELIKTNCNASENKNGDGKKIKNEKNGSSQDKNISEEENTTANENIKKSDNPIDVKLGDTFSKWEALFDYKGERPSMGKNYVCNQKLTSLICDHEIDKLSINVKQGKVVAYIFVLIPKQSDSGVPGSIIKKLKNEAGVDLVYKNGMYGASNGKITVSLFRKNDAGMGGDRIVIYTLLNSD